MSLAHVSWFFLQKVVHLPSAGPHCLVIIIYIGDFVRRQCMCCVWADLLWYVSDLCERRGRGCRACLDEVQRAGCCGLVLTPRWDNDQQPAAADVLLLLLVCSPVSVHPDRCVCCSGGGGGGMELCAGL
jgi:hypothetical protein